MTLANAIRSSEEEAQLDLQQASNLINLAPTESALGDRSEKYPEGGLQAWLVVLGAWCAMVPSMGLLNSLAILQAWLGEHDLHDVPESKIAWIFSCYAFFLYFCGAQVGPIFDAHDVRVLIIPGSVGIIVSLITFSFSTEFYQHLLSFGVLGGISASLLFNPSLAAIGHWFHRRRAFATGVACTAGGLGGVIFPLIILYLAPTIGFAWSIRVVALICAVLLCLSSVLLRQRLPKNKAAGASVDIKALRDPKFAAATVATFLIEFAVFIPYSYISSYAINVGMEPRKAYMLNALLNAGAIPGRALPGYAADTIGVYNTMCITSFTCAAFVLALWQTSYDSEPRIIAFTVLYGFWSGAAISLTSVCIGKVCRVQDLGKRIGTAFFIASFGTLIGIPIAGVILEGNNGQYYGLIWFGGCFYMAACLAFVAARFISGGKQKVF